MGIQPRRLHAERIYGGVKNFVAPLPNPQSIEIWNVLATRYQDEPAVLYHRVQ